MFLERSEKNRESFPPSLYTDTCNFEEFACVPQFPKPFFFLVLSFWCTSAQPESPEVHPSSPLRRESFLQALILAEPRCIKMIKQDRQHKPCTFLNPRGKKRKLKAARKMQNTSEENLVPRWQTASTRPYSPNNESLGIYDTKSNKNRIPKKIKPGSASSKIQKHKKIKSYDLTYDFMWKWQKWKAMDERDVKFKNVYIPGNEIEKPTELKPEQQNELWLNWADMCQRVLARDVHRGCCSATNKNVSARSRSLGAAETW